MVADNNISTIKRTATFAEAEQAEVEYYASISWKESAKTVEAMRRSIWPKQYKDGMQKTIFAQAGLKEDRDDFE